MKPISKNELDQLVNAGEGPCVSIYIPTHQTGSEIQQDMIRFKNLLRVAEDQLKQRGVAQPEVQKMLKPAWELLESRISWRSPKESFAMFISGGDVRSYQLPVRLDEQVVVNDRFHVRPLLRLFGCDGRFYVLALNQDRVRLLEGTRHTISEVDTGDTPTNIEWAMKYTEPPSELVRHNESASRNIVPQGAHGVFHGQGPDKMDLKEDVLVEYFRAIDHGLKEILHGDTAPLVLVGVEYLHPLYKRVNSYAHLLDSGVHGSPELLSNQELHDKAWPVVQPYFMTEQHRAIAQFENLSATDKTSIDIKDILPAASQGRVEWLFISAGDEIKGRYDHATGEVTLSNGSDEGEDLLDLLATQALGNGARVFALDKESVPGGEPVAAVYRY